VGVSRLLVLAGECRFLVLAGENKILVLAGESRLVVARSSGFPSGREQGGLKHLELPGFLLKRSGGGD
jgi:hypothetical protein